MATKCNVRIIQDGLMSILHQNHDGYPEVVGKFLLRFYEKKILTKSLDIENFVESLLNSKSIHFTTDNKICWDCEYLYDIDLDKGNLKCYEVDVNQDTISGRKIISLKGINLKKYLKKMEIFNKEEEQ